MIFLQSMGIPTLIIILAGGLFFWYHRISVATITNKDSIITNKDSAISLLKEKVKTLTEEHSLPVTDGKQSGFRDAEYLEKPECGIEKASMPTGKITNSSVSFLLSPKESASAVKEMYQSVIDAVESLPKNEPSSLIVYDANLQTTSPSNIWSEDIILVKKASPNKFQWNYLVAANNNRRKFNQEWVEKTNWSSLKTGFMTEIPVSDEEWPLPNIFCVPEIGQCFIGFGNYDYSGIRTLDGDINKGKGGGILINHKPTALAIGNLILKMKNIVNIQNAKSN